MVDTQFSASRKTILVTGAAGFIGSAFAREALKHRAHVIVLDALTYAGYMGNLEEILTPVVSLQAASGKAVALAEFIKGDIGDFALVDSLFDRYRFDAVVNFAAESHVDNSISGPAIFVKTNILGTFNLLEVARKHWTAVKSEQFRFIHVSTDEVFGELGPTGKFSEKTSYAPNSPYSASKAGSDLLVRAWNHTYGLPTIITNCSNNYGPRQFPEKLIPRIIVNALKGEALPVYGKGINVRDWIHVEDHCKGVWLALEKGNPGETYCFGGNSERTNLQVVEAICNELDRVKPRQVKVSYKNQIRFVEDRPGHDFRYAIDDSKAQGELGFERQYLNFEEGLRATIRWYLENDKWLAGLEGRKSQTFG